MTRLRHSRRKLDLSPFLALAQVLTLYAAIMLPLTLVAGIYGMNLPLWPPSNHPYSFWVVIFSMAAIAAVMLFYFRRRKWL